MNYYVILLIKDLARKINICKTIVYKLIVIQTLKSIMQPIKVGLNWVVSRVEDSSMYG